MEVLLDTDASKLMIILNPYKRKEFISELQLKRVQLIYNQLEDDEHPTYLALVEQKLNEKKDARTKAILSLNDKIAELSKEYDIEKIRTCLRWADEYSLKKHAGLEQLARVTESFLFCPECETNLPEMYPFAYRDGKIKKYYCGVCDHNWTFNP